jgi:undecaprenyl-diphosphatase
MSLILKAIILGIIQGLTEFLPVSSSGHLLVVQYVFRHVGSPGDKQFFLNDMMFFDVAMHFASILAVLVFFRKRIVDIFRAGNRAVLGLIVVGSIPAGFVGLILAKLHIMSTLEGMPVVIGICFLITAALLKLTDYSSEAGFELKKANWRKALLVGAGQALGILPGVSRSGSTISTGLIAGFKREDAVVFSFFLAIPAVLGASCLELLDLLQVIREAPDKVPNMAAVLAGCAAAFAVSLIAIKLLLVIVRMKKFSLFAYYCVLAAAASFAVAIIVR